MWWELDEIWLFPGSLHWVSAILAGKFDWNNEDSNYDNDDDNDNDSVNDNASDNDIDTVSDNDNDNDHDNDDHKDNDSCCYGDPFLLRRLCSHGWWD